MKTWTVVAMLLVLPVLAAQEKEERQQTAADLMKTMQLQGGVTKVFKLKYAEVVDVKTALGAFEAEMAYDNDLQILSVRGSNQVVSEIGAAIKEIDVPAAATRNVELTFHILLAERGAEGSSGQTLPDDLESVATQLKKVLGFRTVRLAESAILRVRDRSGGSASGVIGGLGTSPAGYQLSFQFAQVIGADETAAIRLFNLRFNASVKSAVHEHPRDVGLSTDVDVKPGQKAVIGKAGVDEQGRNIVLVVIARIV